ncbi:MAG: SDR family oxidoreductase [Deltaproteobacteria bacterium]|nr:SDR family oxidoreductase [Deltaproteobacteria bacterium]
MKDKTILITGGSSGIGRATAVELASRGARLLVQGRTPERCEEAMDEIRRSATGAPPELLQADLSSLAGVRSLAEAVSERTDHLDVLLNNAGLTLSSRQLTDDGFEKTFGVNHLAPFLLTGLLLPLLRRSPAPRIVTVASEGHRFGKLDLDDLQNERRYAMLRVYGQSKTANILFTVELARRLEGTNVTANCLHPGMIKSNLGRGNGALLDRVHDAIGIVLYPFFKTAEQGAQTSLHLVASPDVADASGRYFANKRPSRPSAHATNPETAGRLWAISEQLTEFSYP